MEEFKIVHLTYTEEASIIVKADTNEEAEQAVYEEFPAVPDLKVVSIEDPDEQTKLDILKYRAEKSETIPKEKLN